IVGVCAVDNTTRHLAGDVVRSRDGVTYTHPMCVNSWVDDIKGWPSVSSAHIVCYLIKSKAYDLKEAEAYKSLDSFNFVQSGWVGQVLSHNVNADFVYLKADVRPSQAINKKTLDSVGLCQACWPGDHCWLLVYGWESKGVQPRWRITVEG
ncbi:hypothetical protein MTO96_034924, partial [Rhipicephalus appendiculatus]